MSYLRLKNGKKTKQVKCLQAKQAARTVCRRRNARTAVELVRINHNSTATLYHQKIRVMVAQEIEEEIAFDGEIEVDESYFVGHRKGKRGCVAGGKLLVFDALNARRQVL